MPFDPIYECMFLLQHVTLELDRFNNVRNYYKFCDELLEPNNFLCHFGEGNKLIPHCRINYCTLFKVYPNNYTTIQKQYKSR